MGTTTISPPNGVSLNRAGIVPITLGIDGTYKRVIDTASNGANNMYTVPAGYYFLLTFIHFTVDAEAAGNTRAYMLIRDSIGVSAQYLVNWLWTTTYAYGNLQCQSFFPPIEMDENEYITIYTGGATYTAYGTIAGYECKK